MVCAHCGGYLQGEAASSAALPCSCHALTVKTIQALLRERKLRVSGAKNELLERLCGAAASDNIGVVTSLIDVAEDSLSDEDDSPPRRKRPDVALRMHMQKTHRMTTVKCELNCKLATPTRALMLMHINTLVEFITKSSRAGSLAFNAWMLFHLSTSLDGTLPAWFDVDSKKWLNNAVRQCMTGPSDTSRTNEATLAQVPSMKHVNLMYPQHLVGTVQSFTYLAKTYVTALKNHVCVHFDDRIKTFCSRFCRELPGVWRIAYRFVQGTPMTTDPDIALVLPRFIVRVLTQVQLLLQPCVNNKLLRPRIALLYYMQVQSFRFGYSGWNVAPVSDYGRKHVTIDGTVFKQFFASRLKDAGIYGKAFYPSTLSIPEANQHMAALFNNLHLLRAPPRNGKDGWTPTGSFQTDGYSLCVTFMYSAEKSSVNAPKKADDQGGRVAAAKQQVVGLDPGRKNVMCVAGYNGSGVPFVRSYTAREYEAESGIRSSKEQHSRWNRSVQPLLDQLSVNGASMKTCLFDAQTRYLEAAASGNAALWAGIGHKKTARVKMAVYAGKRRALDAFLRSVPVRRDVRLVVAYGNAKFRPAARGTRVPAPCSLAYQRVCVWADEVVPMDEFRTTMYSYYGKTKLEDVIVQNAQGRRVTLRGLKRCTTQRTLRLLRQRQLPAGWMEDPSKQGTTLVSRDGNAALNIREPLARGNRPRCLRRVYH